MSYLIRFGVPLNYEKLPRKRFVLTLCKSTNIVLGHVRHKTIELKQEEGVSALVLR